MTYHCKGFDEGFNFVDENSSIEIHMRKIIFTQNFEHFCSPGHMVTPWGNLRPFLSKGDGFTR